MVFRTTVGPKRPWTVTEARPEGEGGAHWAGLRGVGGRGGGGGGGRLGSGWGERGAELMLLGPEPRASRVRAAGSSFEAFSPNLSLPDSPSQPQQPPPPPFRNPAPRCWRWASCRRAAELRSVAHVLPLCLAPFRHPLVWMFSISAPSLGLAPGRSQPCVHQIAC
jgi:hypothetical protein